MTATPSAFAVILMQKIDAAMTGDSVFRTYSDVAERLLGQLADLGMIEYGADTDGSFTAVLTGKGAAFLAR